MFATRLRPAAIAWGMLLVLAGPARAELATQSGGELVAGNRSELVVENCGEGVTRFFASAEARDAALPSLALIEPLHAVEATAKEASAVGAAPELSAITPTFQRIQGRPAARIQIAPDTDLYGTGEVPGALRRNGTRTTAWNTDAYAWGADSPSLYQSHPWVLALRADGSAFGVLADTPYRCRIDLVKGILFISQGPEFALIVIEGESPQEVVMRLSDLIGRMPLPPLWSLGYHQCRYSYTPDRQVLKIAREFRKRDIPCDVIWLDIDYMDGYRCFTWHPDDFSDPADLMDQLHAQDFRVITIIDPGIKVENGYPVYDSGNANDVWVLGADGNPYMGSVWPGLCVWPDFTMERARRWWAGLYPPFLSMGVDGIWNDMNEPAVFNVDGHTMPAINRHRGDPELGGNELHARYHNVYGMLMARATQEGMLQTRPNTRPFVLSRANHLGGHRYAATWSGDNVANWWHLDVSIPQVLNLGLSGQPFSGPDIGGFAGEGDGALFARWMGIGAMLPFARGHTGKGNIDKEPWAFGGAVEDICRRALRRRYRLLPYYYTLMREASVSGLPAVRPLFFADPTDPRLRQEDDGFLLGNDLLVWCHTRPGQRREPVLPRGNWAEIDLGVGDAGDPELPRLFLREGAILPLGPEIQSSAELEGGFEMLELLIHPDAEGNAEGFLYQDDYESFAYREGEYRLFRLSVETDGREAKASVEIVEGEHLPPGWEVDVRFVSTRRR